MRDPKQERTKIDGKHQVHVNAHYPQKISARIDLN